MGKLTRGVHIDFHTMPGISDFGAGIDAAETAQILSDANVEIVNFFAQCNIGFAYYPTEIGIPYPYMKGDLFGDTLRECHKRGIKVCAYVNAGLCHEQGIRHPEWCQMDAQGHILSGERLGSFYRTMCYNTGYGDYLVSIIREIHEKYDADGQFCDCMLVRPCYCPECVRRMNALGIDITDEAAVTEFARQSMLAVDRRIREVVPEGRLLFFNTSIPMDNPDILSTHSEVECLPAERLWGYDYFPAKAAYERNLRGECMYMTGRFQSSWGDFGGIKSRASMENDVYDALCAGVGCSIGDHMHPVRGLDRGVYKLIGDIYGKVKLYEKYTSGAKYCADIAVVTNRGELPPSINGAARMLAELKYGYDVINPDMPVDGYRALILPDGVRVDARFAGVLDRYVESGGAVLTSGFSAVNASRDGFAPKYLGYIDVLGADENNVSYYRERVSSAEVPCDYDMYSQGIRMRADDEYVAADYVEGLFNRHWDGLHGYIYVPQGEKNGLAAVAAKGRTAHICFPIFKAYIENLSVFHKRLVASLLRNMVGDPVVLAPDMPSTSRVTVCAGDGYSLLNVKVTYPEWRAGAGIVEEHSELASGHTVSVRGEFKEALLLPDETPVPSRVAGGRTELTLPELRGFAMFLLR